MTEKNNVVDITGESEIVSTQLDPFTLARHTLNEFAEGSKLADDKQLEVASEVIDAMEAVFKKHADMNPDGTLTNAYTGPGVKLGALMASQVMLLHASVMSFPPNGVLDPNQVHQMMLTTGAQVSTYVMQSWVRFIQQENDPNVGHG
jgi:hypothetical protein